MSVEKILEKVDAIEAQQVSKIEEAKAEVVKLVDEKVLSVEEKLSAIEAKLSEVQAPSIIKIEKTVREILAGSGWKRTNRITDNIQFLIEHQQIPESVYSSFVLFWDIRNKVVHGVNKND